MFKNVLIIRTPVSNVVVVVDALLVTDYVYGHVIKTHRPYLIYQYIGLYQPWLESYLLLFYNEQRERVELSHVSIVI